MLIPQLTKYILEELERGTPELEIKQKLFQSQWMPEEIEENYAYALNEAQQLLKQYKSTTSSTHKKGKRTLLLAAIMLFIAVVCVVAYFGYIVVTTYREDTAAQLIDPPVTINPSLLPTTAPTPTEIPLIAVVNQLDRKRDQDRQIIQTALVQYYEDNDKYPNRLSDLEALYLSPVPKDPISGNPYKYETISDAQDYKLCITFEEVGELCFNRLSN